MSTVNWSLATFRKSPTSGDGDCVEVATLDGVIGVRDSKNTTGPVLEFTPSEWRAFVEGVALGSFDL